MIEHSSGRLLTRCVSFLEDQISGVQLIQRSGVEYQAQQFGSMGEAICQLDYEPAQIPSNCFGSGPYWQYFHRTSGGWVQSASGASSWMLHDGDMDGWHYAAGGSQPPPSVSFNAVCAGAQESVPSATAAITHTPSSAAQSATATRAAPLLSSTAAAAPTTTSNLQALAPTVSPTPRVALAQTGPLKPPSSSGLSGIWILLGASTTLLVGLLAFNLLRRGP